MRGKTVKNKGLNLLLAIIIMCVTLIGPAEKPLAAAAAATVKYMKVNTFIKHLVQRIDLKVDTSVKTPYIAAAISEGIVKEGEFSDYNAYITRTDAAVLVNRADEFLHGDTVDQKLLQMVLDRRISDIKKISADKREAVAKVYAKGIIKGYGNGNYTQDRAFKGSDKITAAGAMSAIRLVTDIAGRSEMSPDGQLIRTTNLPKNADKYEYILASFPNKFYEKKFRFMISEQYKNGTIDKDTYAYPDEMRKETFRTWYEEWPLSVEMDKYLYDWADLAEKYLNYVFNVDYRTVDNEWIEGLASLYTNSNLDLPIVIKEDYIDKMKKNKVVVESSLIAVEPSTFHDDCGYCMRAYVRYRITAKNINVEESELIYAPFAYLKNLESGEWRVGIFDIHFGTNDPFNGDGSVWTIDRGTMLYDED